MITICVAMIILLIICFASLYRVDYSGDTNQTMLQMSQFCFAFTIAIGTMLVLGVYAESVTITACNIGMMV
jgi:hypothetical protein